MAGLIHQHQLNLIQQMGKYNTGSADRNMAFVIRSYKDAINSAENPQAAQGLAQALEGILSGYGKSLADVKGLNTNLLNAANTQNVAGKAGAAGQKGDTKDQQVIADLSQEFGIDVKKSGTTKDWLEKAKQDPNVRILDKSGKDITAQSEGRIKQGDILEVNSKKYGKVQISVGGDGEINGKDDKVISMGGQTAANNMVNGLNQINNVPQQQPNTANVQAQANPFAGLLGLDPMAMANNVQQAQDPNTANQGLFNEAQIKSLIAAILNHSVYDIEQKQTQQQLTQFQTM